MSSPPPSASAEHSRDFEELAGLAALRVLEGDELVAFERHSAACQRCAAMVRADREAVVRLGLTAPEMEPSPGFKERLLQRAASELAERSPLPMGEGQGEGTALPHPARAARRPVPLGEVRILPLWRRPIWASLAAVLILALGGLGAYSYMSQVVTSVVLEGSLGGSATVLVRRSGAAEIELRDVPDPPPGRVYEAWIIPPGQAPVPAGAATRGQGSLPLAGPSVRGTTVAMTIEDPGATAPSMAPLAAATVAS